MATRTYLFVAANIRSHTMATITLVFVAVYDSMCGKCRSQGTAAGCIRFGSLLSCIYSYRCQIESLSCHIVSPRLKCRLSYYARPTKPNVATLMRTSGGNTVRKARKHSPAVAPVVKTSSMSKMCRNWQLPLAGCAAKAPRTLSAFERTSSRVCVFVYFRLLRMSRYNATPVTDDMASAMISAWLYPLFQRRRQ